MQCLNKGFEGPAFGPKMAQEHKREFTEEQLRAGEGHIGLQAGYNKGATQSGINIGKPRSVHDWTSSSLLSTATLCLHIVIIISSEKNRI